MSAFQLNHQALAALLLSAEAQGFCKSEAEAAASRMRANAPKRTGALASSITVVPAKTDRALYRVGSSLPYAGIEQAKTGFMSRSL